MGTRSRDEDRGDLEPRARSVAGRRLFRNQSALGVDKLREYATELGLDRARFDASLDSGKFAEKVQRDVIEGRKLGVNGTPTLYINGKRISDNSYEAVKSAIETALKSLATKR